MRITRLAVMAGLAYLGYKLYSQMEQGGGTEGGGYRRMRRDAMNEDSGRLQTLTGPSHRGTTESVGDASGAMGRKTVGRGVVET